MFSKMACFEIVVDEVMGRCLASKKNFMPGDIIFMDKAFVFASYDGFNPFESSLLQAAFSKPTLRDLTDIVDTLSSFGRIQSSDTAKNLILLLAICSLRKKDVRNGSLKEYFTKSGFPECELAVAFQLFDQLQASFPQECIAEAKVIKRSYPRLIPKNLSVDEVGKLLGVVTTNQLEMEEFGGSGLFVTTAILEHSCKPNCSFTTTGLQLYLTAIDTIQPGQRLSIDYSNQFYTPTNERLESLKETYNFVCRCPMCCGPDRKRGFYCAHCQDGVVFPMGSGDDDEVEWSCGSCGAAVAVEDKERYLSRESHWRGQSMETLEDVRTAWSERVLHNTHCIFFYALEEMYLDLSQEARTAYFRLLEVEEGEKLYQEAHGVFQELLRLVLWQLPAVHHEKVVYYDRAAQLAVAIRDLAAAREMYRLAYDNACLACGATNPATVAVKELLDNTPKTLVLLVDAYDQARERRLENLGLRENDDEEDWSDVDEDG